jgi:putative glycosyltransferase
MDEVKPVHHAEANKKVKVLWASRVTREKMPDMIKLIADKLDPKEFQIDVFGAFSDDIDKNFFAGVPVINYRGAFDGFSSLPTEDYDILLYTSVGDGVPNILLEATAAGLPILASNDGGVHEFIQDGKTGSLVKEIRDVDGYVKKLKDFRKNPKKYEEYVEAAQKLLEERHSWKAFIKKMKEDF